MFGKILIRKDKVTLHIIKEVTKRVNAKFGTNYSIDTVLFIWNSQFSILAEAFALRQVVKLDYIGKFDIKEGKRIRFKKLLSRLKRGFVPIRRITDDVNVGECSNEL
jgi:hypothetical protein